MKIKPKISVVFVNGNRKQSFVFDNRRRAQVAPLERISAKM
jgi:hypothetical protein